MKYFATHSSRNKLRIALLDLIKLTGNLGISADQLPNSVKEALDYAAAVDEKLVSSPKDWKLEFFDLFNSDEFNEVLTADECKSIFLTSLKGSSDITYSLLKELGSEYEVDIDEVIPQRS